MHHNVIDLTGRKFGRLTVLQDSSLRVSGHVLWDVVCDCGVQRTVQGRSLTTGHTKSCGCLNDEKRLVNSRTHGMKDTRLYRIWLGMRSRCSIPSATGYRYYGGRGITVHDSWHSFETFYEWANLNGYDDTLSIDRIDDGGNYEPSNCRWITMSENIAKANRRRKNNT